MKSKWHLTHVILMICVIISVYPKYQPHPQPHYVDTKQVYDSYSHEGYAPAPSYEQWVPKWTKWKPACIQKSEGVLFLESAHACVLLFTRGTFHFFQCISISFISKLDWYCHKPYINSGSLAYTLKGCTPIEVLPVPNTYIISQQSIRVFSMFYFGMRCSIRDRKYLN